MIMEKCMKLIKEWPWNLIEEVEKKVEEVEKKVEEVEKV